MKIGVNQPCPCGSGKKYKKCHIGKSLSPSDFTLRRRNQILLNATFEIFGFKKNPNWDHLKRNISAEQIREFYTVQSAIWEGDTDWAKVVPQADATLRGLYIGEPNPEVLTQNILRCSLYADEILVLDPLHLPRRLSPEFNPIERPDQYKSDTLKLVYFLVRMAPWIDAGFVKLIPNPCDFYPGLHQETARLAQNRLGNTKFSAKDFGPNVESPSTALRRAVYRLSDGAIVRLAEKAGIELTAEKKQLLLDHIRQLQKADPIAYEGPVDGKDEQIHVARLGNLETSQIISAITGAFPFTDIPFKWRELLESRDQFDETAKTWTPLTQAFQNLDFRFLENNDVEFAARLREENRLAGFRSYLRRLSATVESEDSAVYVRNFTDELRGEYEKAKADWNQIDVDFAKWAAGGLGTALATGHLVPEIGLSAGVMTVANLVSRYIKRTQFRRRNPLSIFIDLEDHDNGRGTKLY